MSETMIVCVDEVNYYVGLVDGAILFTPCLLTEHYLAWNPAKVDVVMVRNEGDYSPLDEKCTEIVDLIRDFTRV